MYDESVKHLTFVQIVFHLNDHDVIMGSDLFCVSQNVWESNLKKNFQICLSDKLTYSFPRRKQLFLLTFCMT